MGLSGLGDFSGWWCSRERGRSHTLLGVVLKGPGEGEIQCGLTWRSYLGEERGASVLSRFC